MTIALLVVLVLGYIAMGIAFVIATRGASRRVKLFGLVAIAAAAPAFFFTGKFSEQFVANQCYSDAFGNVVLAAERSKSSSEFAGSLRDLPLRGYETDCSEVSTATRLLVTNAP